MEGDGEGMVAIVQGLNDAGVTLTVVNRPRPEPERRRSPRPRININNRTTMPLAQRPPQAQRSAVETSTESMPRTTTGVQICDDRYASSYRMAHCKVTPTSPPERVSEFPPQRKEPNRSQGNFEVGGTGSGQVRNTSARARQYAGSQTWAERDSYCGKSNRESEAFMHSLRKYPYVTPVRTVSSDLIEKLIKYTQSKNSPRASRTSKSMRSLHKDQSMDTSDINKVSKQQQTYTRRQSSEEEGSPVRGRLGYRGRTRNFKLYSPVSDSRNIRFGEEFTSSYDYLKAGSSYSRSDRPNRSERPVRSERPTRPDRPIRSDYSPRSYRDVRLNDVSRYIRSTIREIYNDRPLVFQVCPKLKNRYNQHKKNCPNRNMDTMIDEEAEASVPILSRILASISGCTHTPPSTSKRDDLNCYCTKSSQCSCTPDASTNTPQVSFKPDEEPNKTKYCHCCPNSVDRSTQSPPTCECKQVGTVPEVGLCQCNAEDIKYYNKRIDEEISNWFEDVPINSIESPRNKTKRDIMITELRESIKQLPGDENFDDNARELINNFIADFPIWYPGKNKNEQREFKQQLANQLLDRILNVPRTPDRFKDAVKKWIQGIDFEDEDSNCREVTVDNITSKIKELAAERPICDHYYNDILKKEIMEILKTLPIKVEGNKEECLQQMTNRLAALIVNIPKNANITKDTTDLKDIFEENLIDWLNDLALYRYDMKDIKRDPKLIEALAKKLSILQSQGLDDETLVAKMREEVHKFLTNAGAVMEPSDVLMEGLISQLINNVKTKEMDSFDEDELTELVIDWLQTVPGINEVTPEKFNKLVEKLINKIKEAKLEGREDYQDDIFAIFANPGPPVDPVVLDEHIDELMEMLELWPSRKQYKENEKDKMLKEIYDIVDVSPISEDKKSDLRNKLQQIVSDNLDNSTLESEKIQDDVKDALFEDMYDVIDETSIPEEIKTDLKTRIVDVLYKFFETSLSKLRKDGGNVKEKIATVVRHTVQKLPIDKNNQKHVMEEVGRVLAENINKVLPDDIENILNRGINDIIEESTFSGDDNMKNILNNELSNAASKALNNYLPKYENIGDIKSKIEKDLNDVIDESSLDLHKTKDLKQQIQDILTNNKGKRLSDGGSENLIKGQIMNKIDDLRIPQDKKNALKHKIGETLTKDFDNIMMDLKVDINNVKNDILKNMAHAIEKLPVDRDEKRHLKSKLKNMVAKNLDSSLSDSKKNAIIEDVSHVVSDAAPEVDSGLKNKITRILTKFPTEKKLTEDLKDAVEEDLSDIISEAPLSEHKKNELRNLLRNRLNNNLGNLLSDTRDKIKEEMYDAINKSSLDDNDKSDFKHKMMKVLAKNFNEKPTTKQGMDEYKHLVTKDVNRVIGHLPVNSNEKEELKKLVDNILSQTLYKPLSEEVKANIRDDVYNIIDSSNITGNQINEMKSKLEKVLARDLLELPGQIKDVATIKNNLLKDITNVIDDLQISRIKKDNLNQKVKDSLADNLDQAMSDKMEETINDKISNILDKSSIPENKIGDVKVKFADIVGQHLDILPSQADDRENIDVTNAISNDIDKCIDSFKIAPDKKKHLTKHMKLILNEILYKPMSDEIKQNLKNDVLDIVDDMVIPEDRKSTLKEQLAEVLTDGLESLISQGKDADEIKNTITNDIKKVIDKTPLSKDKKDFLKHKIHAALINHLIQPLTDDRKEIVKEKFSNVIDNSTIPEQKKDEFKMRSYDIVDKNFDKVQNNLQKNKIKEDTVNKVLEEMQETVNSLSLPEEKKKELRDKLKKATIKNLNKPLTDDIFQDTIDSEINNMVKLLPFTEEEQKKLKSKLANTLNDGRETLRKEDKKIRNQIKRELQSRQEEAETKDNILHEFEGIINASPMPEEKKSELRKKLNHMAAEEFKKPLTEETKAALKDGISNILNELPVSKEEKNKLKAQLNKMVDRNIESLQIGREAEKEAAQLKEMETRTQDNILRGLEKIIDDSSISPEKKLELKQRLKEMAAKNFNQPLTEEVRSTIQAGIKDILDELPIPKEQKTKLKSELNDMVDKNIKSLCDDVKRKEAEQLEKMETDAQDNILRGLEKSIDESPISEEKKLELKKRLKDMATKNFDHPFSDAAQDAIKAGISDILNELPIPEDQKKQLKAELTDIVDDNVNTLRDGIKTKETIKLNILVPPQLKEDEVKTKDNILYEMETISDASSIPEKEKSELKRNLHHMAVDKFKKPLTDDTQVALKDGISNIVNELPAPKEEKKKLKDQLNKMVDRNIESLKIGREAEKEAAQLKEMETLTQRNILRGLEKSIDDSPISPEKKLELKQRLKEMAAKNFNQPLTEEVQSALQAGINDILDELPIPKEQKTKLKTELNDMVDKNIKSLRDDVKRKEAEQLEKMETDAQDNILRGLEKSIDDAPISHEKKLELKKRLKDMATKNFDHPFSHAAQDAIKTGISDILNELPIPEDQKKKLKAKLTDIVDDNVNTLRDGIKTKETIKLNILVPPQLKEDEVKTKDNILHEMETISDASSIPEKEKSELKRNLHHMAVDNFKKPLTDDTQVALKHGISNIVNELPAPKEEKNKLKGQLNKMVDRNIESLKIGREAEKEAAQLKEMETRTQDNILRGLEKTIDDSPIPPEKKLELKQRLKEMAAKNFNQPLTEEARSALQAGINDILDELPIPKEQKTKLKSELNDMVDKNIKSLRDDVKRKEAEQLEKMETDAQDKILRGLEKSIDDAPISQEKKLELKKRLKDMATKNFDHPFSNAAQDAIKTGINDILNELPIPEDQKKKLKAELTDIVDDNVNTLRDGIKTKETIKLNKLAPPQLKEDEVKTKDNILHEMETISDASSIPVKEKSELKRNLHHMAVDKFKKPLTDDTQVALKHGISNIVNELPAPKEEKNKLKAQLNKMVDRNIESLKIGREAEKEAAQLKEMETRTQDNILRGLEKTIDDSPISPEKKLELKQRLKEMAAKNFNQPLTEEVQSALQAGINDILDELPIPKEQKTKLKTELNDMVDKNIKSLRNDVKRKEAEQLEKMETNAQDNILRGLEKSIDDAPISHEKKLELKKKLKDMATKNFDHPFSDAAQDAIKTGISDILNELPIPEDQKKKLKAELTDIVDDNVNTLRDGIKTKETIKLNKLAPPQLKEDEVKTKDNILHEMETISDASSIPEKEKSELKRNLHHMAVDKFKKPLTDDTQVALKHGISNIVNELPAPKEEKNKLKAQLNKMVDRNIESLKIGREAEKEAAQLKKMETRTQDNILRGLENTIDDSPIPPEKKLELKQRLKEMAAKNFNQPLTEEVRSALQAGINDILDELPIPKEQKTKLKSELNDMVDKNIKSLRDDVKRKEAEQLEKMETDAQDKILRGLEKSIDDAPISQEKKLELKKRLKDMATKNFDHPFSDAAQDAIKTGINDILNELPIPEDQKKKLKAELTDIVDDNVSTLRDGIKTKETIKLNILAPPQLKEDEVKTKDNILHEMETISDASSIPEKEKSELKRNLHHMAVDKFKKPLTDDTQEALKDGISNIVNELPAPKAEKKKLKDQLNKMVDRNIESLKIEREAEKEAVQLKEMETRTQDKILRGLEKTIDDSPISPEKKLELKQRLKEMAAKNFNQPLTEEVQSALQAGINDILDELPIPKEQKTKLKTELNDMVDKNIKSLRDDVNRKEAEQLEKMETDAQDNILRGLEKSIDDAPMSQEKKLELKKRLKDMATKNFDHPFSDAAQDAIKAGINDILNELPIPEDQKKKLKTELADIVDDNVSNLRGDIKAKEAIKNKRLNIQDQKGKDAEIKSTKQELGKSLNEEIGNIMRKHKIDPAYIPKLEEDITNDLKDLLARGGDIDNAKRKLALKIMQDTNLSEEDAMNLSSQLVDKAKEMSFDVKLDDSKDFYKVPHKATDELVDIHKPLVSKKRIKESTSKAINDVIDQSDIPKTIKSNLKSDLKYKLDQDIDRSPLNRKKDFDDFKRVMQDDTRTIVDTSLVPADKKKQLKLELDDALRKVFRDDLHFDTPRKLEDRGVQIAPGKMGKEYADEVAKTVKKWINNLAIDFDPEIKEQLMNDLAKDIIHRQKYLQVHSDAKSSPQEELQNLKYQVFRRLSGVVPPEDMELIMRETKKLLKNLTDIGVPTITPQRSYARYTDKSRGKKRRHDDTRQGGSKSVSIETQSDEVKEQLREIVGDVLEKHNVNKNDRNNLEADMVRVLEDFVTKGGNPTGAIENVKKSVLQLTTLSPSEAEDLSSIVVNKAKVISTITKTPIKLDKTQVDEEDKTSIKDDHIRKEKLSKKLDGAIANLPISRNERIDLKQTLTDIYDEADRARDQLYKQSKLTQNIMPNQHSTPTKDKRDTEYRNERSNNRGNVTTATGTSPHSNQNSQALSEEAEIDYTQKIEKVFTDWANKAPIKVQPDAKDKIVRQLTGDIVDRKKYFQITPRDKPTHVEDLDNLKYQLYRRMNRQMKIEELTPILDQAGVLLDKVDEIAVPEMIVPPGFAPREDSITDDGSQAIPAPQNIHNLIIPLHEKIQEILDSHNIFDENREEIEADLIFALEDLAVRDGDIDEVTKNVFEIIKQLTPVDGDEAEEMTVELINAAKEIAKSRSKQVQLEMRRKDFQDALYRELGDVFEGCPMTEEKRRLMERQLAEQYAQDLGISLKDSNYGFRPKDIKILESDIRVGVNDWMQSLPINISDEDVGKQVENKKKNFISKLSKMVSLGDFGKMREETNEYMQDIPLDIQNNEIRNEKADELIDKLVSVPHTAKPRRLAVSFNGLSTYIDDWLDNVSIQDDNKTKDEIKKQKNDIAFNLIHKIGEMNVDLEIFNDSSLYEDVLRDELHNLFDDLTITSPNFETKKEELIEKIKDAHQRAKDEIAGQTYKQNLRDTISKVLPESQNLSQDEQASLEIMKDQIADAFINLHYSGSNADLRDKMKQKILNELNKFCKDYQNKRGTPLNSEKLNRDLYNALKNVPLPVADSIKYEVEQVRIRDEINDWVRELPLEPQTPAELLARSKLIYILSKKLFEIETELDDSEDVPMMRKEILKFLKKIPLKRGQEKNSLAFANKLIEALKATEASRKFSESCIDDIDANGNITTQRGNVTPGGYGTTGTDGPVCPYYKSILEKRKAAMQDRAQFPPCSLSPEDVAHLDRIRHRSCLAPKCISSIIKANKRNAGVGPRPVDIASQTELRPESIGTGTSPPSDICPVVNSQTPRPCPGVPANQYGYPKRRAVIPSSIPQEDSLGEIQPHIIVKEYHWDSVETSEHQQPSDAPCHRQTPSPYKHPHLTPPCAQVGTSPYSETELPHQQGLGQQQLRLPCDHVFPCPGSKPSQPQQPHRYPHWSPQRSFQVPQERSSHGSIPCPRSPCPPSPPPCMSPLSSPFAPRHQSSPLNSPASYRPSTMPKRDGLQDQTPCSTSRPHRKERVIELGSLDDLCHPRPKRNDNVDWSYARFPEEDNFWGGSCMRRVILDEGIDEPMMMEREKKEERMRCKCKERIIPKTKRGHIRTYHRHVSGNEDPSNLNRCSKCCGMPCPYPSYMFFRQ